MLGIGKMGKKSAYYYASLAQESCEFDPHKPGEPSGHWLGEMKTTLNLPDAVDRTTFLEVFSGFAPNGEPLTRNAGSENRTPGWDFTFSPPKSVSVAWALAPDEMKAAIGAAHRKGYERAISFLERHSEQPLLVAAFEHGTNRNGEPFLHTHCLVMNTTTDERNHFKALSSRPLYQLKMEAGALYRAEVSYELMRYGFSIERSGKAFEIAGFSRTEGKFQRLMNHWSSRRQEIEREEPKSAKYATRLAMITRGKKGRVEAREELFARWAQEAKGLSVTRKDIERLLGPTKTPSTLRQKFHEWRVAREALKEVTLFTSSFTDRELRVALLRSAVGRPLNADSIERLQEKIVSKSIALKADKQGNPRYTLKRLFQLETSLHRYASELSQKRSTLRLSLVKMSQSRVGRHLTKEQRKGLTSITSGKRLSILSGVSGTGKTQVLAAAAKAYRAHGCQVIALSDSAEGQRDLEERGLTATWAERLFGTKGIENLTLNQFAWRLENATRTKPLTKKTVILVDQAHRLSAPAMRNLIQSVKRGGATLVLAGDSQLGIGTLHQGALSSLAQKAGAIELKAPQRINPEVTQSLAKGRGVQAVKRLEELESYDFQRSAPEAIDAFMTRWKEQGGVKAPEDHVVFASKDVRQEINDRIKAERQKAGVVSHRSTTIKDDIAVSKGDRIRFTATSRQYGVARGQLGTLESINGVTKLGIVRLDSGEKRLMNFRHYDGVELGYAVEPRRAHLLEPKYVYSVGPGQERAISMLEVGRGGERMEMFRYSRDTDRGMSSVIERMVQERDRELSVELQR